MTAQAFWDRKAPKYAQKPIADSAAYEDKLQHITALLRPTDRVLEIGCGTGGTARRIVQVAAQVTATDISAEMIRIARARSNEFAKGKLDFFQAEASQEIEGYPFDAVCAFSLLHLVDNIPEVLEAVFRQVKPGGYFISKTVCLMDAPRGMQLMVRLLTTARIAPKVNNISRVELTDHLTRAGFEIDQIKHFGKNHTSPFIVAHRPAE
ncbi:Methyltransferase domain-containing protein [Aliiroseovarius halocynthiae]|uniref:Class I SAM-dependent methyltransferase n=1 Tax=Aliiroseovarius halocynthiae TaxID=985055 RepID=A0A545SYC6_9RHOB|nr:class I SAM-dependent methyltransferase [Aliiroseovarius halocynthiae]TQV69967.1 class I SAM-dependent methyltransferase [Aliiroseovarius halocynthiae]SMR70631.1 Methyltransferase domain-containing protein [Aliiroseovarius halocynthiae]